MHRETEPRTCPNWIFSAEKIPNIPGKNAVSPLTPVMFAPQHLFKQDVPCRLLGARWTPDMDSPSLPTAPQHVHLVAGSSRKHGSPRIHDPQRSAGGPPGPSPTAHGPSGEPHARNNPCLPDCPVKAPPDDRDDPSRKSDHAKKSTGTPAEPAHSAASQQNARPAGDYRITHPNPDRIH